MKRSTDGRKRCINLMSPKYSVIVAENRRFSSRNYLGFFFVIFCQASLYRTRFQASSGNSDSASWPGYEAGFNRRFGNAAFFSSHKFKHLRVSGKTNLPKCSGFSMNRRWNISTAKKIDLKLSRHQSDESKRAISMLKIILKTKLFLLKLNHLCYPDNFIESS